MSVFTDKRAFPAIVEQAENTALARKYKNEAAASASTAGVAAQFVGTFAAPFDSWISTGTKLSTATGMSDGTRATVMASDTGTHASVTGDVGSEGGQTPNSGVFEYSDSVSDWVRKGNLDSTTAQEFVAETETLVENLKEPDGTATTEGTLVQEQNSKKELLGFNNYGDTRINGIELNRAVQDENGIVDVIAIDGYRLLALDTATGQIIVGSFDGGTVARLAARLGSVSLRTQLGTLALDDAIEFIPANGQSNGVAAGLNFNKVPQVVLHTSPLVPVYGLMFNTGLRGVQGGVLDPATITDFVPAFEQQEYDPADAGYQCGETQGSGTMAQYHRLNLAAGEPQLLVWRTHADSGEVEDNIDEDSQPFANAVMEVAKASSLAASYGRSLVIRAVTMTHGEADRGAGTTKADYKSGCEALLAAYRTSFSPYLSESNPDIAMIFDQLAAEYNATAGATAGQPALAMYELARDNTSDFFICTPKYLFEQVDTVHFTPLSHAVIGEYNGKLRRALRAGSAVSWMIPTSIIRTTTTITITFGNAVGDLVLDTDTIPASADSGFEYSGANITDVSVSGNEVTITIDADAGGTLSYAWTAPGGASSPKRSGAWGNLRDSDYTPSVTDPTRFLHNWCPVFQETVA